MIAIIALLLMASVAMAAPAVYRTTYNPFTARLDYVWSENQTGTSLTISNLTVSDTATITNLIATNLEGNLDATGFNITAINEVASTLIDTTNLEADNLESNLDATGYSITASTELASITGDFDNLEATNLESNLDGTGYTLTIDNLTGVDSIEGNSNNVRIGNGTDSHTLTSENDLFVSGQLEVDGASYFDGIAYFLADASFTDNIPLTFGASGDVKMLYGTAQTPDAMVLGIGADSNGLIIAQRADLYSDFGQPLKTNPTVFVQSADATSTDQFLSLEHDQSDARVVSGEGNLRLSAADNINVDVPLTIGDESNYLLFEESVNGTHAVLQSYEDVQIILLTYTPNGTASQCYVNDTHSWVCEAR